MNVKRDQDNEKDDRCVNDCDSRERWGEQAALVAESSLPKKEERLRRRLRMRVDVLTVPDDRLTEGCPGEDDWEKDHDLAEPVEPVNARWNEAALSANRIRIGMSFCVERAPQVNVGPFRSTDIVANRTGKVSQAFGRSGIDLAERGRHTR